MLSPTVTYLGSTAHPPVKLTPAQVHAAQRCQTITMGAQVRVNRTV